MEFPKRHRKTSCRSAFSDYNNAMRLPLTSFLMLALLIQAGCSSKRPADTLELESILQYKAEREARKQAKEAAQNAPPPALAATAPPAVSDAPRVVLNPEELQLLKLPETLVLLSEAERRDPAFIALFEGIFAEPVAVWKMKNADLYVLAGKTPLNAPQFQMMTKKDFTDDIVKTALQFEAFYQKNFGAHATYELTPGESLITLKVMSKYSQKPVWMTDIRYFFFYNPNYRLNFLIHGSDDALGPLTGSLEENFKIFQEKLSSDFSKPIPFRQEPENTAV